MAYSIIETMFRPRQPQRSRDDMRTDDTDGSVHGGDLRGRPPKELRVDRSLIDCWRSGQLDDDDRRRLMDALRDPRVARDLLRDMHFELTLRCAIKFEVARRAQLSHEETAEIGVECIECSYPRQSER